MKIIVGSKNPVKISATKKAFEAVFPDEKIEVEGREIDSAVAAQPLSDSETIKGARHRARKALEIGKDADFGVGIEGGMHEIDGEWFESGWMAVLSKDGKEGLGSCIRMYSPKKVTDLIKDGKELGEVTDILFGTINSKQQEGHFGIMTKGLISREHGYMDGIITALTRFIREEIY